MDDLTSITADDLAASHENFSAERVNIVAKNAVTANGIRAAARRPEGVAANALGFRSAGVARVRVELVSN